MGRVVGSLRGYMLKRLFIGLLKGLVVGGAIGAGIQYGLHWEVASAGLLGYLLAMGAGGTTGVFAGRPPWQEGAWVEALLKGLVGVGAGALVYWVSSTYGALALPFPGMAEATPWTALPVVFLPGIAGVYGALVELDNAEERDAKAATKSDASKGPRTRVVVDDDADGASATEVAPERTRGARGKR